MKTRRRIVGLRGVWCAFTAAGLFLSAPAPAHPEIDVQIADLTVRIASQPGDPMLYVRRGELHRVHRRWSAAEADFRQARKVDPELGVVDFHLGRMLLEAGEYQRALETLNRFLAASPRHVEALVSRARVRSRMGEPAAAAVDFTAALAALGDTGRVKPTYYVERSRALQAAGRLEQAVQGLDEGLARLGDPVTLELYAIELELLRGRHDAALTRLERIAARSARAEAWLVRRGEILEQTGRTDEAREAYTEALEAIAALPVSRRWNRAVQQLEQAAGSALERLGGGP